ncbi:MAG: autotransporter-associated beta strand repeat-containing protein [Azoarcus sp.]|nr:autotransporter-associated beta strand repeat-containing protein [Azoarcus sp.]
MLAALFAPLPALAGDITISSSITQSEVAGNGTGATGNTPFDNSSAALSNNSVTVEGTGSVTGSVYGGASEGTLPTSETATGNRVIIESGGSVTGVVNGGRLDTANTVDGTVSGNTVESAGTVGDTLSGGFNLNGKIGTATGNSVTISGGSAVTVNGGHSETDGNAAIATSNTVTISGGMVTGEVRGGNASITSGSGSATATGNTVKISGGTVTGNIYGGQAETTKAATVTGNTVTITTTSKTYANLYGGKITGGGTGDAFTDNELNLAAGNTITSVQNFNTVNFTSAGNAGITLLDTTATGATGNPLVTLNTNAYNVSMAGELSGTGGIDKTGTGTLTLSGVASYTGATTVSEGTLVGNIANNTNLTIAGGATYQTGGAARTVSVLSGAGNLTNADGLTAQSGTFSGVISGNGSLTKTSAGTLTLSGANTFSGGTTVSAGTLQIGNGGTTGSIVGNITNNANVTFNRSNALTYSGDMDGTGSLTKTGAGTLTLSGTNSYTGGTTVSAGTLAGDADSLQGDILNNATVEFNQATAGTYGGILSGTGSLTKTGSGTLTLSGTNTYTGLTEVKAGTLELDGASATFSNKLALYDGTEFRLSNSAVAALSQLDVRGSATYTGNLDTAGGVMSFYVPAAMTSGGTLLTVIGDADISGATVQMTIDGTPIALQTGDTLTLLDATGSLTGTPANTSAHGRTMQGITVIHNYDFELTTNAQQLTATVSSTNDELNPQTKSLSEGYLSGVTFVNQGADFAAGKGMEAAVKMAKAGLGRGAFAAISGGTSRYKTGSHVDVDGFSLMAGLSWGKTTLSAGRVTLGAFLEYGKGNYDTYNSFSNAAKVHGKGDLKQYGAGILGRFDAAASQTGNWYAEASLRAGRIDNDYGSSDLRDSQGRKAEYSAESAYASVHLGTGYVWKLTEKSTFDLYGKAFWTRQEGDSVRLSTGEEVKFEDADSMRLRLGGRLSYTHTLNDRFAYALLSDRLTPYVGLAWEHEFDGKAKAKTNGYNIDSPNLKGNTGVAEIGFVLNSATLPLSLDLGVQGYGGQRKGVTGSVRMKFEF